MLNECGPIKDKKIIKNKNYKVLSQGEGAAIVYNEKYTVTQIVKFSYDHLIEVLKHVDNYSDKKFSQKLRFLRRKYKLNKEQEGKKDCQLASDLYQAISKIDMLNLKDVSYNVNYNFNYSINQSFRMFKSILDEAENKKFIPLKNNKFINFEDVSKIIYYIKKEKIQLLVGNIFDTNSYKQEGYTVNKDKESFVEFRDEIQLSKRDNANTDEIISTSMRIYQREREF